MNGQITLLAASLLVLQVAAPAVAEIKTTWKRNAGDAATPRFAFDGVPSPSRTDAAVNAKITVVAGRLDRNSANTRALHDGRMPAGEDEPGACVFFAAGTEGGRLLIDLGGIVDARQVNTYSWHRSTRGPQVYELFGSDGSAAGSDAAIRDGASAGDPRARGWTHIASVDTRDKEEADDDGGQYAVNTADSEGGVIGRYRYLLLVVSRTEDRDPFGNTFFSEIDVIDGQEHQPVEPPQPEPLVLSATTGPYEIRFDLTEMPELREWVEQDLQPVCEQWYPKIVEMLPSEGFEAPRRVSITFRKDMRGVAYTSRGGVFCAGEWFSRNLHGEAKGAVVHELVHIVQRYGGGGRGGNRNPGWLVEGLADYIRWFLYEPADQRPRVNPARAKYTDGYRTTAAFLNYVMDKHNKELIRDFNTAMREGRYSPQLWVDCTGKTVDELWIDYVRTLEAEE